MVGEACGPAATPAARAAPSSEAGPATLLSLHPLVAVTLVTSIYLQRFGLNASGAAFVSAGHLILPLAGGGLLLLSRARIDLLNLMLLVAFVAYALVVATFTVAVPPAGTGIAPQSLVLVATLYAVLCIAPVPLEDLRRVLVVYNRHMLWLGLLGIAQFALQFVGIRFFTFEDLVPDRFLIEDFYNVVIPLEYASPWFKSNGVFFLEPSFFSQFVAIALAAEVLLFRRPHFVAVYGLAIVASYSGSGLLTLATSLVILSVIRPQYSVLLVALLVTGILTLAAMSQVAPEVYAYYVQRALETGNEQSSGYLRYVTPYLLLDQASHGLAIFFGHGPGAAEKFRLGYEYTVNALVKFLVDYGLVGATLFFTFLLTALTKRGNGLFLIVLSLSWYFVGGGYHLTSCVVHMMAVFLLWSTWSSPPGLPAPQPAEERP